MASRGGQGGIGADPVVMAVSAQEAPVQAHLPALAGGDDGELGREEVLFDDAVGLVEQVQNGQLHPVCAVVIGQRNGAHDDVQLLTGDALGQRLLHLITGQVNQQVRHAQHRVGVFFANGDGDDLAVFSCKPRRAEPGERWSTDTS